MMLESGQDMTRATTRGAMMISTDGSWGGLFRPMPSSGARRKWDRRHVSSVQTNRLDWNLHRVLLDGSRLGQRDLQHASGEERLHRLGVRLERQSDRTCKLAERPLLMAVVALLQVAFHPLLAFDGENVVAQRDLHVLLFDARQFGLDFDRTVGLAHAHARRRGTGRCGRVGTKPIEDLVDLSIQGREE